MRIPIQQRLYEYAMAKAAGPVKRAVSRGGSIRRVHTHASVKQPHDSFSVARGNLLHELAAEGCQYLGGRRHLQRTQEP